MTVNGALVSKSLMHQAILFGYALTPQHPTDALTRGIFLMPPATPTLPRPLIFKQLSYDLTSVAGLALVGHYLNALRPLLGRLDAALPVRAASLTAISCAATWAYWCRARATSTPSRTSATMRCTTGRAVPGA